MKPHNRIQQFCAFSLILLFSIQAGLGLWLHRVLHQHPAKGVVSVKSNVPVVQQDATFSNACTCTDNFLVPFISVTNTEVASPVQTCFVPLAPADYRTIPCGICIFHLLRGPPVLTV